MLNSTKNPELTANPFIIQHTAFNISIHIFDTFDKEFYTTELSKKNSVQILSEFHNLTSDKGKIKRIRRGYLDKIIFFKFFFTGIIIEPYKRVAKRPQRKKKFTKIRALRLESQIIVV